MSSTVAVSGLVATAWTPDLDDVPAAFADDARLDESDRGEVLLS